MKARARVKALESRRRAADAPVIRLRWPWEAAADPADPGARVIVLRWPEEEGDGGNSTDRGQR